MKSQKVKFKNKNGLELAAKIEFPNSEIKGYALFAHCFTCNKNLTAVRNIGRALNKCGIAVLRFDFTGLGESEGDFENVMKKLLVDLHKIATLVESFLPQTSDKIKNALKTRERIILFERI